MWLIVLTLALMIVSVPHVLEDFRYGDLLGIGAPATTVAVIALAAYTLQGVCVFLTGRGNRTAALVLGIAGAVWCIGAVAVHGHDLLLAGVGYRHGAISKVLEALLIVLGAAAAYLGMSAYVRLNRP